MVKEIKEICVFAFFAMIQKFKMAAIFGERNFFFFFLNWQEYFFWIPWGSKHFDEIALSRMVKEIEAN